MKDRRARAVRGMVSLIDETRLLFHHLRRTAESLHRQGEITAGRRGVLESLHREGPRTVPQLARARPVSRQHIQKLVDPLAAEGLVELVDNPRHKRSKLVRLTAAGAPWWRSSGGRRRCSRLWRPSSAPRSSSGPSQ